MGYHFRRFLRTCSLAGTYSAVILASFYLAYDIRFDFQVPPQDDHDRLKYLGLVLAVKLLALILARQFTSLLTYFSFPDLLKLFWAMLGSSGVLVIFRLMADPWFRAPRAALLVDFLFCFGGLCATRTAMRLYRERFNPERKGTLATKQKIAIVGAGDAGASLAREFINSPSQGFKPVAFLDDDPGKHGKLIHGVPVLGRPEILNKIGDFGGITKLVVAMPSAPAKRIRDIVYLGTKLGLKVETLPSMEQLASGVVRATRIRPIEVEDLLGRAVVALDYTSIGKLINDRVVMVTGAGGSIGSELCRQIAALGPKRLLMVEQAEGSAFVIEQDLNELELGLVAVPLVVDVLDRAPMQAIFAKYQPQIIFHAAAHKHVHLMERQPAEAIRNNVFGTRVMAQLALEHKVTEFVLISTDKAINPTSVMGATKRLAELQIQALQATQIESSKTKFMAVRFGNVLESSGSVIPIFKRQIARGGPVTVTHPDVTRYFMTIPEAVGLVLQSAAMGSGGEIFVLDMGQPVKIADLARQMVLLSGLKPGEDIEITFTGLKPGEKLYEEYQHHAETHQQTEHPRVMRFICASSFDDAVLEDMEKRLHQLDGNQLKMLLKQSVPEYTPHVN